MISSMQMGIIKKDIKGSIFNKNILIVLIAIPLLMVVILPLFFVASILFLPEDSAGFMRLIFLATSLNLDLTGIEGFYLQMLLSNFILNDVLPLFFLFIPIFSSAAMAANSFVGEKEKKTLETLLYSPLPVKDIFNAKIFASFILGMTASFFSFLILLLLFQVTTFAIIGTLILPSTNWAIFLLLLSPAFAFIAIVLIVRSSAKAQSVEEASNISLLLMLVLIVLGALKFGGVVIFGAQTFFIIGLVLFGVALFALRHISKNFTFESLLN